MAFIYLRVHWNEVKWKERWFRTAKITRDKILLQLLFCWWANYVSLNIFCLDWHLIGIIWLAGRSALRQCYLFLLSLILLLFSFSCKILFSFWNDLLWFVRIELFIGAAVSQFLTLWIFSKRKIKKQICWRAYMSIVVIELL